jgi:CRISPR/Cas system-associated endoribonuclease Cas2
MTKNHKAESEGRDRAQVFRLPDPDDFDEIVSESGLNDEQANELSLTIRHIAEDLETFEKQFEGRKPRAELVPRLKRLAKILGELEDEIRRASSTMSDFLPFDTLEEIGLLMSYSALEAALDCKLISRKLRPEIERILEEGDELRIAEIESRFDYERRTLGLEKGPRLLAYLIRRINRPIKTWVELDRLNRGGRPSNMVRDYVLIRLAQACRRILGKRPTATASGSFVRLCVGVFNACGLDDEGIEKAVDRILTRLSRNDDVTDPDERPKPEA